MSDPTRDEKVTAVAVALRKFVDSQSSFASHMLTDDELRQASGVAVDTIAQLEAGQEI